MPDRVYFDSEIDPTTGDMRMTLCVGPSLFKSPYPDSEAPADSDPTSAAFHEPKEESSDDSRTNT